jgi:site-specific recombinase
MLVRENQARKSVTNLLRGNFQLLTRKIVERNAETGEHYIARTAQEYGQMVRHAAGGGAITALTIWFKTVIFGWHLAGLQQGLASSLNYAASFVGIQLCGFTLATKQPATTAPALAARMHQVREPAALEALVDEIVFLIRSQFAAILGNICLVVPTVLGLHFLILLLSGAPMMNEAKATATLHSLSILGPSFFFAALTGVLLWASSLVAAATENWFVYHRIGDALEADQRLKRLFGTKRNARISHFLTRNIAGFGGNISLGFMLGLLPELAAFAGLPLDVRHITLSSGSAAAAVACLGSGVLLTWLFWLAALGILLIGVLNVGVSFLLAMLVAIRARNVRGTERRSIYVALWKRLCQQPASFVLPVSIRRAEPIG